MSVSIGDLVEALDGAVLRDDASLDAVGELVARRAAILDRVLELDPDALTEAERAALTAALERAERRDGDLMDALLHERDRTAEALDTLVDARRGARGYRGGARPTRGSVLKSA